MNRTSHSIIITAASLVPDMQVRWDGDADAYRTYDVASGTVRGISDPIHDVRDVAFIVASWLRADGIRVPADLEACATGGAAEISSRPSHLKPGHKPGDPNAWENR